MQRVSILQGINDHDIVQIQVNTSTNILLQNPRSISLYKKAKWNGMKQALEAYHQDMLESGKYSSLNAVQLWDDLHSTLTSLTNKFIPSKLSSTRNNLPWVNQKLKRIAGQRDRAFQKYRKSGKPANRKKIMTSSTYSESPSNFLINLTLRIFLMWSQMILPPNPIQKKTLKKTENTHGLRNPL